MLKIKDKLSGREGEAYIVGDIDKPSWIDIRQESPDTWYIRGGGTAKTGDVFVSFKQDFGRSIWRISYETFVEKYEVVE